MRFDNFIKAPSARLLCLNGLKAIRGRSSGSTFRFRLLDLGTNQGHCHHAADKQPLYGVKPAHSQSAQKDRSTTAMAAFFDIAITAISISASKRMMISISLINALPVRPGATPAQP
jgi:hypothetical protein